MALYAYFCPTCHSPFDLMRPMSEAQQSALCPRCGSKVRGTLARGPDAGIPEAAVYLEPNDGSPGGLPGESRSDDANNHRSSVSTTAVTTPICEEKAATGSGVGLPKDTTPLNVPQTAEYQPSGSNLWYIRDWGIASMFGYLRESRVMERAAPAVARQAVDEEDHLLPESDSAMILPSESEWRMAAALMPWLEETCVEPSETQETEADIGSEERDRPGLRPRRKRPDMNISWPYSAHTKPAQENQGVASRQSRPTREETTSDFSDDIIEAAWSRQGGRCAGCGRWLVWSHKDRGSGTGAWEAHHRIPVGQGGEPTLANCILLCSGVADCHFNLGHGGVSWSHYAPMGDLALLFLFSGETTAASRAVPPRRRKSLWRKVLGIPQAKDI